MRKLKTVSVEPLELSNYRRRASECRRLADHASSQRWWYGTCINAVHAAIALADCLCIFFRRTRYAGSSHDEAITFYSTLQLKQIGFRQSIQRLGSILSVKNAAEYAGEPLREKDATTILKHLERFQSFAIPLLPK